MKDKIDQFIEKKYQKLLDIAYFMTKNDEKSYKLLHDTYLSIIESKNKDGIKKSIDNDSLFAYFIKAMKYQKYSKYSKYRENFSNFSDELEISDNDEDDIFSNWQKFLLIKQEIHHMWEEDVISHYEYNLFLLYFDFESMIDITHYTLEEVVELRKISYRKLEEKTNIKFISIHHTIKNILKKLKKRLKNSF